MPSTSQACIATRQALAAKFYPPHGDRHLDPDDPDPPPPLKRGHIKVKGRFAAPGNN